MKKRMSIIIVTLVMMIVPSVSYIAQAKQTGQQEITSDGINEIDAEGVTGITLVKMDLLYEPEMKRKVDASDNIIAAKTSAEGEVQEFAEVTFEEKNESSEDVQFTVDMSAFSDILSQSNVDLDEDKAKDLIITQAHNGEYEESILAANPYDAMTVAYNKAVRQEEPETEPKTEEKKEVKEDVNEDDLYVLSHAISAEAGSTACEDKTRYYVGSVILNRLKSDYFAGDTIKDIVFASGQYACVDNGSYYKEPTERSVEIARDLLENGSVLPDNVLFQANFKQGDGVYDYIDTVYFCIKN